MLITTFLICISVVTNIAVDQLYQTDDPIRKTLEKRTLLAGAVGDAIHHNHFPAAIQIPAVSATELYPTYTLDESLQTEAEKLLKQYKPDYGAIFVMNAETGRVLAMTSYQKDDPEALNWNLRSNFPAASTFKVVTATVALDKKGLLPSHKIHYNGGHYTLYRKNVMSDKITRWTNVISLKDAFARSINTAFGRLSLEQMDPADINDYASRFMFNQEIPSDFPVEPGVAYIPPEKGFELTEVASGYNKTNKMSPVQGAMISGAVANNGRMMIPYLIETLRDKSGKIVYQAESLDKGQIMSRESAQKLRELMSETVTSGTSRKSFRSLLRNRKLNTLETGGKTGHLTGEDPQGRVDWFVGYGRDDSQKISVAAVTVSKKYWTVKSAHLAQTMMSKFFSKSAPTNSILTVY